MLLLKNKRAWKRWAKDFNWGTSVAEATTEPVEFPCFVYETVGSFAYEESSENYLYRSDLERMLKEL
jgi:hypothetical protein